MEKIEWCLMQAKGMEAVEPNENLRVAYLLKSEDALKTLQKIDSKDWRLTTAYYCIYLALYSICMKIGIKSEIHTCTIAFAKEYLRKYLTDSDIELLEVAFSARIDAQYYTNKHIPDAKYDFVMKGVSSFYVKCKNLHITEKEAKDIRSAISDLKKALK